MDLLALSGAFTVNSAMPIIEANICPVSLSTTTLGT
jgi:hypothetical protein